MFSPEARKEAPASERAVEKSLPSGRVWEKEIWISRARTPAAFEASGSREREPRPARALWAFTRASTWAAGVSAPGSWTPASVSGEPLFSGASGSSGDWGASGYSGIRGVSGHSGAWGMDGFSVHMGKRIRPESPGRVPTAGAGTEKTAATRPGAARYGSWAAWEERGAAPAAARMATAVIA